MKMHIEVGTFQSGKSLFLRLLLLFKLHFKYAIKCFISYKICYFTIHFTTRKLRIDVENLLSEHCNANHFSTLSILHTHEGS